MKHIRQSSQEHTSGSFYVTKDMPGLTPAIYLGAVLRLPISDSVEELFSVSRGTNLSNLKKDPSEPSGIGSPGRCSAPRQALPLYMNQASLQHDVRPEFAKNLYRVRIAIHRDAARVQPCRYQPLKESLQLRLRILGDPVLASHNHVSPGIHQRNKAAGAVQKCPVKDEMVAFRQAQRRRWSCLPYTVIDHIVKLPGAIYTLFHQLSDRVTFNNPKPKPFPLFSAPSGSVPPPARVPAGVTIPALLPFSIMPISPKNARAPRTKFFWPCYILLRSN